jgi:hypothetical protein
METFDAATTREISPRNSRPKGNSLGGDSKKNRKNERNDLTAIDEAVRDGPTKKPASRNNPEKMKKTSPDRAIRRKKT